MANKLARPPAAKRISRHPHPVFRGDLGHGFVFADLSVFQFSDPDLAQSLGFEQPYIFVTQNMTFGQELAAALAENGTAENPSR